MIVLTLVAHVHLSPAAFGNDSEQYLRSPVHRPHVVLSHVHPGLGCVSTALGRSDDARLQNKQLRFGARSSCLGSPFRGGGAGGNDARCERPTKTGVASVHGEGSGHAYDVRLQLTKEVLTIQKQDVICASGSGPRANHRTVTLRRQPVGGLGLSIKGGVEHGVPVVISKIFRDLAADQTGMLFVGDALLQVNGINVESATHKEVVHLLKNAGDEVTITVEYLREAPSFLKLPLGSPGPSSQPGSGASSPFFDSGLHLNGSSSNTAPSSPSSPVANEPKYEKRWLDALSLPLSMARVSSCRAGADTFRSGAIQVQALDGLSSGPLQFHTAQERADWLRAVSANISDLMLQNVKMANKCCSPCDQVVHMGWVSERLGGAGSSRTFRPRFLALKGSSFYVFVSPPVSPLDWVQAEKTYHLCEVLFKVHKLWLPGDRWAQVSLPLGLRDPGGGDHGPFCFSILVSHGGGHVFTVELGNELAAWELSFQRATFRAVQRTGSKTYPCSWQGASLCFTVDFVLGFTCFDSKTKHRGGAYMVALGCKMQRPFGYKIQHERKELEFQDLTAVLHCIHSFMAAKVASVDPAFMDSQSIAGRYMYSS
nr:gamma-2-syntrophin [Odocoileus virginianus texanus]